MGIKHATVAPGTDSGDGEISKNAWDEDHDLSTLEIADIPTAETDVSLRLAPDGVGGVAWGTGGTSAVNAAANITAYNLFR